MTTVSGQGQLNRGSTVFQGGSKGASKGGKYLESGSSDLSGNKGQIGGTNLAGAKSVTITNNTSGIQPDALSALIGSFSTPAPNYSAPSPAPATAPTPSPAPVPDSSADTSAAGGGGWTIAGYSAGTLAVIGLILFLVFKKR